MLTEIPLGTIVLGNHPYKDVTVRVEKYADLSGPAVQLYAPDEELDGWIDQLATVSVNLHPLAPAPGCIWVKDYSENEGMLDQMEAAGLLARTGRTTTSGYVTVPEARMIGALAELVSSRG